MAPAAAAVVVAVVKSSDLVARRIAREAYERPWLQKPANTTTIPAAAAVPAPPKPALKPLRFASSLPAPPKPAAPARAPVAQPLKSALRAPGAPPRAPRNVTWDLPSAPAPALPSSPAPVSVAAPALAPAFAVAAPASAPAASAAAVASFVLVAGSRLPRPSGSVVVPAPASPPVAVPASSPAATPAVVSAASFGVSPPPSMEGLEMTLEDWEREGRETMARIRANGPFVGQYKYVFRSLSSSSSSSTSSRGPSSSSASSAPPSDDHSSSWTPRALASLPSAAAALPADSSKLPTRRVGGRVACSVPRGLSFFSGLAGWLGGVLVVWCFGVLVLWCVGVSGVSFWCGCWGVVLLLSGLLWTPLLG